MRLGCNNLCLGSNNLYLGCNNLYLDMFYHISSETSGMKVAAKFLFTVKVT